MGRAAAIRRAVIFTAANFAAISKRQGSAGGGGGSTVAAQARRSLRGVARARPWPYRSAVHTAVGWWCCLPRDLQPPGDEPTCHVCGDTFESIVGVAPDAELHALTAVTQGTTYGRSLHSLAGRVQDVRVGLGTDFCWTRAKFLETISSLRPSNFPGNFREICYHR